MVVIHMNEKKNLHNCREVYFVFLMRFYINQLLNLTRFKKQLIMVMFDFLLLPFSLMLAYALRFNNYLPHRNSPGAVPVCLGLFYIC